ncbi:MAG: S26 family signal peptidase [Pseudomonadota bacterium]
MIRAGRPRFSRRGLRAAIWLLSRQASSFPFLRSAVIFGLVALNIGIASTRWTLLIEVQAITSIQGVSVMVLDRARHDIERGAVYAFDTPRAVLAVHPNRPTTAKIVAGLPGDEVVVTVEGATVNGELVADGLPLLEYLELPASRFETRFVVPDGALFVVGTSPFSYDSRYWGTVPMSTGQGRAWIIM